MCDKQSVAPASLEMIAAGKGPLSSRKLRQLRQWIRSDWEAADIDRDAVKVIERLLTTLDGMRPIPYKKRLRL